MKKRALLILFILLQVVFIVSAQIKKVDAIGITVGEMNRSVKFFSEVLNFKKVSDE